MTESIRQWLTARGLERFADAFEREEVTIANLASLTDADLQALGLPLGPRRTILAAIAGADTTSGAIENGPLVIGGSAQSEVQGERRQLTVLFCDLVGYTELASRVDPEVLQGIVRVYEDTCAAAITRYEGYVYQRLGDGIVAFFGYPLAHEGEAERAIRAGLDIIEALSELKVPEVERLSVRIGIATGLVVVTSAEKGAVGETMNLAARLQGIAPVNTVVVSERVRRLAGGAFDYQDLGKQALKGISPSTHAYSIVGVSDKASRFEAASGEQLTPLVGRDLELGLLMNRWALAQDGEGQVVLLSGEPGIGKSRILSALRERLESNGAQAIRLQCSPYYVNSAFWPTIDNFERALKFERDETPESKLDKLEALIVDHFGRPKSDVRFVASMLSIPFGERYGELTMTPQKFKDETLRTLVDLTEVAARKQPSAMLYEDLHWADPTTLELADLLIDRVKAMPLLIVITHRPEFRNRWPNHGHVTSLNLSKLTRGQSTAMISELTGGKSLPEPVLEQVLHRTDGVPLFVEELTKAVLESGELADRGDRYEITGNSGNVTIPVSLRDSLMARLDRYVPVKEIAQIGAVIGREFSYELIAAVVPTSDNQLDDALAQLISSGLAFRRGTPPDAMFIFKHALVQDLAYDSLLNSRKKELHAAIVRAIEQHFPHIEKSAPGLMAHHCARADRISDAVSYHLRAGIEAMAKSAYVEARAQFTEGLELVRRLPPSEQMTRLEIDLLIPLGSVLMAMEGQASDNVKALYEHARSLCSRIGDDKRLFAATFNFWTTKFLSGDLPQGRKLSGELFGSALALDDPGLMVQAHHTSWATHTWCGNLRAALHSAEEGMRLYDPERDKNHRFLYGAHDPRCCAHVFRAHLNWMLGYPDTALRMRDEAYNEMRSVGHPFTLALLGTVGMNIFYYQKDIKGLFDAAREIVTISERDGFPITLLWARVMLGWAEVECGDSNGLDMINSAIVRLKEMKMLTQLSFYLGVKAIALITAERFSDALDCVEEALATVARNDEHYFEAELLRLKAELLSNSMGQIDSAQECLVEAVRISRQYDAKSLELRAATSLGRIWRNNGRANEALELLKPVYDWFTEGFDTKDLKEAKALLEELGA